MNSKDQYVLRILKTYSILVDYDGETGKTNVPSPVDAETFGKWRTRVFGSNVTGVTVFAPMIPAAQKSMTKLQDEACATNFVRVIRDISREKDAKKEIAVNETLESAAARYSTFPQDALGDILDELEHVLEPSVEEFFQRWTGSHPGDIDVESMLRALINSYNNAVKLSREAKLAESSRRTFTHSSTDTAGRASG